MQSTRSLLATSRLLSRTAISAPRSAAVVGSVARLGLRTNVTFTKLSHSENLEMLNKQRNSRPSSPHFTIYQPQITWYASIIHRVTGVGLSTVMYTYFAAFALSPLIGFSQALSSASLVDLVATLPFWFKAIVKAPLAAAFSFHSINGLRHLTWDMGYCLTNKRVIQTGYAVVAASALSTIRLLLL